MIQAFDMRGRPSSSIGLWGVPTQDPALIISLTKQMTKPSRIWFRDATPTRQFLATLVSIRGHQPYAHGRQVVREDIMSHLPVCFKNILKFLQKWIVDLKRKIHFSESIKSKSNLTMNWAASDTIAAVLQTLTFFWRISLYV